MKPKLETCGATRHNLDLWCPAGHSKALVSNQSRYIANGKETSKPNLDN